jgi:hypothetical protein
MSFALTPFVIFAASQIGTPTLVATSTVAAVLLGCQIVLHPLWTLAGAAIAKTVADTIWEKYLMWTLAGLTVASVLFVLFGGGK